MNSCQLECPYLGPFEEQLYRGFITNWCPEYEAPDENLYCKLPSEVEIGCTFHYRGSCLQCSDPNTGVYPPHEAEYYMEDEESNIFYMFEHTPYQSFLTRNSLRKSCQIPHCFYANADNTECLVCNNRETGLKMIDDFIDDNFEFYYDNGYIEESPATDYPFMFDLMLSFYKVNMQMGEENYYLAHDGTCV